jgi:hypothetical protein
MNLKLGGMLKDLAKIIHSKVERHSQAGLAWAEIGTHDLAFGVFVGYKRLCSA